MPRWETKPKYEQSEPVWKVVRSHANISTVTSRGGMCVFSASILWRCPVDTRKKKIVFDLCL